MTRTRKKKQAPIGSTRATGDVLEEIVAEMHQVPSVLVERNVFLPVHHDGKQTREIDVLITSQTAGIPVRIAIECKNEIEKTGIEKIDSFIGKLQDVNLPTQLGIFVSRSGYTSGALRRTQSVGIHALTLKENSISETVIKALQSTIYFLLAITNIRIRNNIPFGETASGGDLLFFHDRKGNICGSIPDLVWEKWIREKIPSRLGDGMIQLKVPSGWKQVIREQNVKIEEIAVSYTITGFGMSIPGTVIQYQLLNEADKTLHKSQVTAKFLLPNERLSLSQLDSEEDLNNFEKERGEIRIVNKIRTPRIRWLAMYWPPSNSTILKLNQRMLIARQKGEIFDLNSIPLAEIEGDSLSKLWEPVVKDHPMLKQISKKLRSKAG
jgi:hypothetical protein